MSWFIRSIRKLEADLVEVEAEISLLRCEQIVLLGQLDSARASQADGSRSLVDLGFSPVGHESAHGLLTAELIIRIISSASAGSTITS